MIIMNLKMKELNWIYGFPLLLTSIFMFDIKKESNFFCLFLFFFFLFFNSGVCIAKRTVSNSTTQHKKKITKLISDFTFLSKFWDHIYSPFSIKDLKYILLLLLLCKEHKKGTKNGYNCNIQKNCEKIFLFKKKKSKISHDIKKAT